jgi:hydrogenase nickel incorporation protein HypA/HybF
MHEMSMAENILEIIRHYVPDEKRPQVRIVKMRVCELTNLVSESLEFCFTALTRGGPLEKAVLKIEKVPLTLSCNSCSKSSIVTFGTYACPSSTSSDITFTSGRELQVVELELDEEGSP